METTRKCGECKNLLVLEKDDFVIERDIYYHAECLVNFLTSSKRRKKQTEDQARSYVDGLREDSKRRASDIIAKERLVKFLQYKYDVVTLPSTVFTRLEAVYSGTYKGMTRGIPVGDVLDIWERQWNYMQKTYAYNMSVGKKMENVARIYYDLAIVLAKSTSYYKWKEGQLLNEQKKKEIEVEIAEKIDYNKIDSKHKTKKENENAYEIMDILDEI